MKASVTNPIQAELMAYMLTYAESVKDCIDCEDEIKEISQQTTPNQTE